ncbi:conserved hypothetical protein, partial [Trichinella spiralis]
MAFRKLPL